MEKHAIFRMINYHAATPNNASRLSNYLRQLSRTEERYVITNYLTHSNAKHGIETIERRYHPGGTRSFKQGIVSFGASRDELSPEKARDITKAFLMKCFPMYPWMAAVHLNKPERMHSHFLVGTTNVHTGRKMSQSRNDLQTLKKCYNELAKQHGMPLMIVKNIPPAEIGTEIRDDIPSVKKSLELQQTENRNSSYYPDWESFDETFTIPATIYTHPPSSEQTLKISGLYSITENFREDFKKFFLLGWKGGY